MSSTLSQRHFICLVICIFDVQFHRLVLVFFLIFSKILCTFIMLQLFVTLSWFLEILLGHLTLLKVIFYHWQVSKRARIILTLTFRLILVHVGLRSAKRFIGLANTHVIDIIHLLIGSSRRISPLHI